MMKHQIELFIIAKITSHTPRVALFIIERSGRRPLLLAAIFIDLLGILLMALADFFAPSQMSGVLGERPYVWHRVNSVV
jgi:hypothetical protein